MNYTVKSGDTLSGIAGRYHVTLGALEGANKQIKNPNQIYVGEHITVPGKKASAPPAPKKKAASTTTYTVKHGDTLSGIASKHHVTLAALEHANPQIKHPNQIQVGQHIHIPGKASAPAPKKPAPKPPSSTSKVPYGEPWKKGSGQISGSDTSSWQSKSTFESATQGKEFAAIKATEGTGYTDPTFKARWAELGSKVKSGSMKLRVAYCYLDKGNGAAQAKHFLSALGIKGKLPAGTRLALDWEGSALSSPQTLKDAANQIHKVTGLWPIVYTSASQAGRAKAAVPGAPMWEAQWTGGKSNHSVPFVQYSDGPGYDHDVFNGSLTALERFAGWIK